MPWKRRGKRIFVKKGDEWKLLKEHPTAEKAQNHLEALYANAGEHAKKGD
jgi:hypothetical protein